MAIPGRTSLIQFNRKYDRLSSRSEHRLQIDQKAMLINEAQELFFENMVSLVDLNSDVRDTLRPLEMKEVSLKKVDDKKSYSIFGIPSDSFKILRQRVVATKGDCGEKEIPLVIFQTDDLDNARRNPFWKSSFEWEHVLGDEGSDGLYAWHENDFKIKEIIVDYYRKPKPIHFPSMVEGDKKSYFDSQGREITQDQGFELDARFDHRKIIDIAVLLAKADLGDVQDFQVQLNKILNVEKINL